MNQLRQPDLLFGLSLKYADVVATSYHDLEALSGLHPDFVGDCITAINAKKERLDSPLLGEFFPHLVSQGLNIPDEERRRLAAAWVALYGFITLVDFQLDRVGTLDARTSMSASALLGWGVGSISAICAKSLFADIFHENVRRAFVGQYRDMAHRSSDAFERASSDIDKNRAIVAAVAGYCAAAGETSDRLIRCTELLLAPFQILDDLQDLQEDLQENNSTTFVRIVRKVAADASDNLEGRGLYLIALLDPEATSALNTAALGIRQALLLLDPKRDTHLISFFAVLHHRVEDLVSAMQKHREGTVVMTEPELLGRVREILCNS